MKNNRPTLPTDKEATAIRHNVKTDFSYQSLSFQFPFQAIIGFQRQLLFLLPTTTFPRPYWSVQPRDSPPSTAAAKGLSFHITSNPFIIYPFFSIPFQADGNIPTSYPVSSAHILRPVKAEFPRPPRSTPLPASHPKETGNPSTKFSLSAFSRRMCTKPHAPVRYRLKP